MNFLTRTAIYFWLYCELFFTSGTENYFFIGTELVCEDTEISVEDNERTITMVEDVVSMSQMSLSTAHPLPTEEEAVIMDFDDVQAPRYYGTCIAIESALNEEPSSKVIDNRTNFYLTWKIHWPN